MVFLFGKNAGLERVKVTGIENDSAWFNRLVAGLIENTEN